MVLFSHTKGEPGGDVPRQPFRLDAGGATRLYPLADFQTRRGDDIEKGYLQGRYGAVPFDDPASALGTPR